MRTPRLPADGRRGVERGQELIPEDQGWIGVRRRSRGPGGRLTGLYQELYQFLPCAKSSWVWTEEGQDPLGRDPENHSLVSLLAMVLSNTERWGR